MNETGGNILNAQQLASLQAVLHQGSANASVALKNWIGKESVIEIDSTRQLPLEEATALLAPGDQPICFCSMELGGMLAGEIILAFDDASGLALADMLTDQQQGTTTAWNEMSTSAALETANILCCAYLNSLADSLADTETGAGTAEEHSLVPQPPKFSRDFAASLLQFALMGQAIAFDQVIVAGTRFEIDGAAVNWTLLFVPDAQSMGKLAERLTTGSSESEHE